MKYIIGIPLGIIVATAVALIHNDVLTSFVLGFCVVSTLFFYWEFFERNY